MNTIILGTRGSELALVQARDAAKKIAAANPGIEVVERIIKTTGDKRLDLSLSAPGPLDKGLFTKELESALLDSSVDIAVHSLKDVPTEQPPGLTLGAILERFPSDDCLISKLPGGWSQLPHQARVATSSIRRRNQLLCLRPDLVIQEVRGNISTRIQKLIDSDWDGLIVARAALLRLGDGCIPEGLHSSIITEMLPAPGQGAVAIQCREADLRVLDVLAKVHHVPTALCVEAERNLLRELGGGCHLPLGALATWTNGQVTLRATLFDPNGKIDLSPVPDNLAPQEIASSGPDADHR